LHTTVLTRLSLLPYDTYLLATLRLSCDSPHIMALTTLLFLLGFAKAAPSNKVTQTVDNSTQTAPATADDVKLSWFKVVGSLVVLLSTMLASGNTAFGAFQQLFTIFVTGGFPALYELVTTDPTLIFTFVASLYSALTASGNFFKKLGSVVNFDMVDVMQIVMKLESTGHRLVHECLTQTVECAPIATNNDACYDSGDSDSDTDSGVDSENSDF